MLTFDLAGFNSGLRCRSRSEPDPVFFNLIRILKKSVSFFKLFLNIYSYHSINTICPRSLALSYLGVLVTEKISINYIHRVNFTCLKLESSFGSGFSQSYPDLNPAIFWRSDPGKKMQPDPQPWFNCCVERLALFSIMLPRQ